ncbi:hypothetical protein MHU86_16423 [Fragilaria crotonensis]|nr:hypothetical protein MHU86_16423 [Fragilaria crotonensis]
MECSPVSISPSRDCSGLQASVTQYDASDVTDSLARVEQETEEVGETEGSLDAPTSMTTSLNETPTCATSETAPVTNDEPQEPPRRRYARRSSATMYNLHNYGEPTQMGDN